MPVHCGWGVEAQTAMALDMGEMNARVVRMPGNVLHGHLGDKHLAGGMKGHDELER